MADQGAIQTPTTQSAAPIDRATPWTAEFSDSPSVPELVTDALRRQGGEPRPDLSPGDVLDQATVGAAISILAAFLADESIGPLPALTAGLVEILLTPSSAEQ